MIGLIFGGAMTVSQCGLPAMIAEMHAKSVRATSGTRSLSSMAWFGTTMSPAVARS